MIVNLQIQLTIYTLNPSITFNKIPQLVFDLKAHGEKMEKTDHVYVTCKNCNTEHYVEETTYYNEIDGSNKLCNYIIRSAIYCPNCGKLIPGNIHKVKL